MGGMSSGHGIPSSGVAHTQGRRAGRPPDASLGVMTTRLRRLAPVLFVLVLAPVTAEYLIGYDDTLTHPDQLLWGLLFFGPLYGAPAILIREVTRRRGLGWPSLLLLATAFGLVEAGLVDQSLFDPSYRDISYWPSMREPTYLPWLGTSAYMLMTFLAGHVLGSIAAPVALAESWWPQRSREPWLGRFGLGVVALTYVAGSALILGDQLSSTSFRPSAGQLLGTGAVVVALVVLALTRRPASEGHASGTVPAPWHVAVVAAVLLSVRSLVPTDWVATLVATACIALLLLLVGRWSRRRAWTGRHLLAVAVGDLVSIGGPAFLTSPLGDPSLAAKLTANVVLLSLVLAVAARGYAVLARQAPGRGSITR